MTDAQTPDSADPEASAAQADDTGPQHATDVDTPAEPAPETEHIKDEGEPLGANFA